MTSVVACFLIHGQQVAGFTHRTVGLLYQLQFSLLATIDFFTVICENLLVDQEHTI